uniref:Uncharacterized protein n=1 Tax=Rhodococcus sp. NS1 TaxID=402236 RepID=A0A097SQS9_9NOCA|nr:hypothetical protein LRS1606.438 [Rhodococcus sp. NS1]
MHRRRARQPGDSVIGGDLDRGTVDLSVLDTATGGVHAHLVESADGAGYARILDEARRHAPGRRIWALEGTGSFPAGLSDVLAQAGEDVTEVGSLKRARGAKNDRFDAIRAAQSALAREHPGNARARGLREVIRTLTATREGVLVSRTKAIDELKSLIVAAPEHLRAALRGLSLTKQLSRIESSTTTTTATVEHRVTVLALQSITARIRFLTGQLDELDAELGRSAAASCGAGVACATGRRPRGSCLTVAQLIPSRAGPQRGSVRLARGQ